MPLYSLNSTRLGVALFRNSESLVAPEVFNFVHNFISSTSSGSAQGEITTSSKRSRKITRRRFPSGTQGCRGSCQTVSGGEKLLLRGINPTGRVQRLECCCA